MELEVTPASIGVGESWGVKVFVTPANDKVLRLRSVAFMIRRNSVNGAWTPTPLLPASLARGERAQIAEIGGAWQAETSTWVLEVKATTDRGDTISNRVALRKP